MLKMPHIPCQTVCVCVCVLNPTWWSWCVCWYCVINKPSNIQAWMNDPTHTHTHTHSQMTFDLSHVWPNVCPLLCLFVTVLVHCVRGQPRMPSLASLVCQYMAWMLCMYIVAEPWTSHLSAVLHVFPMKLIKVVLRASFLWRFMTLIYHRQITLCLTD